MLTKDHLFDIILISKALRTIDGIEGMEVVRKALYRAKIQEVKRVRDMTGDLKTVVDYLHIIKSCLED